MENTIATISDVEFVSFAFNGMFVLIMGLAMIFAKRLETLRPKLLAKSSLITSRCRKASILSEYTSQAPS
jgi:hypothetical protein